MSNYPDIQLFIDGQWRHGAEGKTLPIIDPATEEEIGRLAHATRPDLDAALEAAEKGFGIWRNTSVFERYQIMRKAAQLLRERLRVLHLGSGRLGRAQRVVEKVRPPLSRVT